MDNGLSAADVLALTNNNRNCYNDGMWDNPFVYLVWMWAFSAFGGGFGGFGRVGANGALTRAEMYDGFTMNNIERQIQGVQNGLCSGFYDLNTTNLQGFNGVKSAIAENRFAAQNCCCETNRNIDAVRYENAKNTCDIVRAIEKDGDATRALINANTMQALRDKLVEQNQELQTANFQLSQQAQSANIINTLRPVAQPAYLTCSPYQANHSGYGFGGCGGCGGCSGGWGY